MSQQQQQQSSINYGQDEIPHLRSQNDQLWKIIEKQRVMIQNLQKDNVRLSAERDGLQDQVNLLEKEITRKQRVTSLLISPQALREIAEQEDAVSTPSSETTPSPIEVYSNATVAAATAAAAAAVVVSPMPPPRSPYRPLKEKAEDFGLMDSSKRLMDQEPESYIVAATSRNNMEDYTSLNGRSSPGSPAPGPHSPTLPKYQQQQRKDSAPLPSTTTRNHSPFIVPSPSKSSSSLEVRKNARQRDSMMPPARAALEHDPTMRAASPPLIPSSSSFRSTNTNNNSTFTTTNTNINANINTNNTPTNTTTTTINNSSNAISTNPVINSNYIPPNSSSPIYGRGKNDGQSMYSSSRTDLASYGDDDDQSSCTAAVSPSTTKQQSSFMGSMANVCIKVVGSNIKPNDKGKEVVSFILSVGSYKDDVSNEFEEKWRVEKLYSDFLTLDSKLKAQRNRAISGRIGKLPDKALFSNNAPTKVDQRKVALEQYLQHIVSLPLEDASDLCEFLSTNVMDTKVYQLSGQKEGYLTKRGKNFGGWKTRYFVLNESVLEYYESKEGTQLGSIRLTNAQIGTQMNGSSTSSAQEEYNSVYRHAFLIVEQKRVGSTHSVRHILCANSDDDRDTWVHALLQNISIVEDEALTQKKRKNEKPRKLSKGEIRAISATPISHLKMDHVGNADMEKLTSVPSHRDDASIGMAISSNSYSRPTPSISSESTTDSTTMASSLPSNNNNANATSTWSSYEAGRTSLDQRNNSNTLQAPRPPIMRRSSMGNLISNNEQQQQNEDQLNFHNYRRAVSPTIISRVPDEAPAAPATESEKKARNKAHRMTFWGKKMLFNSSEDQDQQGQQQQQQQQQREGQPRPSQSSSATTSSSNSAGLRGFLSRSSHEQNDRSRNKYDDVPVPKQAAKQVFGVSLEEAVRISRVAEGYELPAVVYRCIEYLDAMDAVLEEGLYRLSGSNATMKALRERFNQEGDVNLLAAKEEYDVHVVAGLLKMWLRELPTSVLTREHRMDFLHVIDLLDRKDRVNELGRLVSVLPLSNYTLLRALTAHLIRVVQHSDINKMTMRNVSIVFSPTLGIPATIFNLFMSEFEYIFWTTKDGDAAPRRIEDEVIEEQPVVGLSRKTTLRLREEHGRSNRNSVNYMDGAPNAIVDLEKHMDGPPVLDEDEDEDVDDLTLSNESNYSVHSS
ncbi:RalA-binding protein 1 [Mucor circinelloides 1006PhL]|uniref:RalA-binding protein 1 n=1 Tax=Mucor circinelloides f. circinelloides (strain 1006PhL) TaxID=1220926 RepID=S2KJS5_MUCC1|nr:RalA-binding protein 1 [Mucor circinelloides 1006PhL]